MKQANVFHSAEITPAPRRQSGSLTEHTLVLQTIVQHITATMASLRSQTDLASSANHFKSMSELFSGIGEAQFAGFCSTVAAITSGRPAGATRNWSFEAQRLAHQSAHLLYSSIFGMLLDGSSDKFGQALVEQLRTLMQFGERYRIDTSVRVAPVLAPAPAPAPEPVAAPRPVLAAAPTPERPFPWNDLIRAVDELQWTSDEKAPVRAKLRNIVSLISSEYSMRLQDALAPIRRTTGKSLVALEPDLLISKNLVEPLQFVLGNFFGTVAATPVDGIVDAKCVGAYFLVEFSLGPVTSLPKDKLLKFYDSLADRNDVAYLEFLRDRDGNLKFSACIEAPMPSFLANQVTVADRKFLIPAHKSIQYLPLSHLAGAEKIPVDRLFGIPPAIDTGFYLVITLGRRRYAIPVSREMGQVQRYSPNTRDLARFRKFGFAGTAELEDGGSALIWDLSIAVDRWAQKFQAS